MDTVLGNALDLVVKSVGRELGYLYEYRSNVDELKSCVERLKGEREIVKHKVQEAKKNGENIEVGVIAWLKNMDSKITEIKKVLEDEDFMKTGCTGLFPYLWLRHQLGRKAKKMMSPQVGQLLEQAKFDRVSYRLGPAEIDAAISDRDYVSFDAREATVGRIMDALKDSTVEMIGVYGLGGVGKTTLVKQVARKAEAEKLFDVVVMANITSTPDMKKIQGEIAEKLGMRLDEETDSLRAGRMRQRLMMEKENNTLIILDDLWAGLDLNRLGISFNDDDISQIAVKDIPDFGCSTMKKENSPGDSTSLKILLTSRSRDILTKMDVKEKSIFPVDVLEETDALKLFKMVVGITDHHSHLDQLSAQVVNKCANLPMAIVTAGKALKNNMTEEAWKDMLRQMERQEMTRALEPMKFSMMLSYHHLESDELKSFFLLCARMGKDILIMDLMKYCIGMCIFEGVDTVKEARNRTDTLIKKLQNSSLLLNSYSSGHVTMHDMVRDAALSLAYDEQHIFTVRYGKLDEWPDNDNLERYTAISLHHCDNFDEIPEGLNFPRLKVFHVETKNPSLIIPDKLFEGMRELRVLILIGVNLSSLPSSIKCLKKLRMLCLEQCVLGDSISIIGELKKLRVLSLSRSVFECLPRELGQLSKLQMLDISNCTKLRVVPPNVLSSLISLEELYVENNSIQWSLEGQTGQTEIACLSELWHLEQLKRLDIYIQDVATLPRSWSFDKLDNYKVVIGDFKTVLLEDFKKHCMSEASSALALQLEKGKNIYFQKGIIKMLLKSVDHLFLRELNGVQNFINELNLEGFPCLKHLTIIKSSNIQYIISSMEGVQNMMAFPELESLCLDELESMEKICNTLLTDTSFCNLKTIKINSCSRLKNLFPVFMVSYLEKLETIEVSECDSLQEIVVAERQENIENDVIEDNIVLSTIKKEDNIVFPQLHTLTLQSLPKLTSFCNNDESAAACLPLFNIKVSNLTELKVKGCGDLKYLFSLSMVGSLVKLESLYVEECAMMKDIFKPEDISTNEARKDFDVFPQLKKVEITSMEELGTIWLAQASLQSFNSLDFVTIKDCNKLVSVFPDYMVGRYKSLGSLEVMNCKLVEKIFDLKDSPQIGDRNETTLWNLHIEMLQNLKHIWSRDPQGILDFKNLQNVHVMGCPNIENVFPTSVAKNLPKLKSIRASTCPGMKEIVAEEDRLNENAMFEFPQLTTVALERLPKLTSFYQGRHTIKFQALKRLYLLHCDKFETTSSKAEPILLAVEEVICKLEAMGLGPKAIEWLYNCVGNDVYQLRNIKALYLDGLKSMEILFWFLQRTPRLEHLFLVRCHNREMLSIAILVALEKIGTVVQLKSLRLWHFHVLQNLGFLNNNPIIQRVEQLYLVECSSLITLLPSSVTFTHLTYLEVSRCMRLKNLMTSSTAKSLAQLTEMKVTHCEMIEEIVASNKEEGEDEIVFQKLKSLQLLSLINLKSFCSSKNQLAFKFPSLEKLTLGDCFRMEIFCENLASIPHLRKVIVREEGDKWFWEGDLNTTIKKIFKDMVFFEYAENLQLFQHPELERVLQGQVPMPENCFCNLKSLVVVNCFFPSSAFLSKLLCYLKNLEKLEVRSCPVEVIFDVDESNKMNEEAFQLKILTLDGLTNLKCVWSKDSHGLISFQCLQEVVVNDCRNLETLFPASLAEKLVKLEISKCNALVEIVGEAEAAKIQESKTFKLPNLTTLFLYDLPELKCFYPGMSILECPDLSFLRVLKCTKLDVFTSEIPSHQEAHGAEDRDGIPIRRQPLLLIKEVIPNLETLWLNKQMTLLCIRELENILSKLKVLVLFFEDDNEASTTFPFGFLLKLPNLTSLSIGHFNALKEVFPSEKPEDIGSIRILERLRALTLFSLPSLSSIGLHHSWLDSLHQNLEDLRVHCCPCLTDLVCSSAVSFCNLTQLTITKCHGLVSLFPISTAKTLVKLENMIIEACTSLKRIVAKETVESASDEIITFEKLTTFTLNSLPSLVRFCSGNVALQFPTLQVASICHCPKMKIFSQGVITAPNNISIQLDSYDLHNFKDLDTTLKKLFQDKDAGVQDLILGDHPELEDIWHSVLPTPDRDFSQLKSLVVDGCEFYSNVIPFHLLPHLSNLETLEVRKCDFVKAIFDVKDNPMNGTEVIIDARMASPFSLPLKKLVLEKLPNLEHIWTEDPEGILNLQCLQQVCVHECEGLRSLFPASVAMDKLEKLEVKCCTRLVEIVAKDETEAATRDFVLWYLNSLTLWDLPELRYFYSGLRHLEWPKLNELVVYHCFKLRTFTSKFHSHYEAHQQAIVSVEKVFPNLKELLLSEKDVMMLSHENFDENLFRNIKYLKLMCFHGDETAILPYGFLRKVRWIGKLLVGCSCLREIFPAERPYGAGISLEMNYGPMSMLGLDDSWNLIAQAYDTGIPFWLKELELNDLPELISIGLEHSWHSIAQQLESLQVLGCSSLIHLVPSTVSFSSLVDLTVRECHKLEYLFTSSTTKSLILLKNMSIGKCDAIKNIVAEESDDSDKDVMIFHQLETLSLHTLPTLGCFYPGSSKLNFPWLQNVSIRECGRMKLFCQNDLVAPKVPLNLNAGIQRAHDNKTPYFVCVRDWALFEESKNEVKGNDVGLGSFILESLAKPVEKIPSTSITSEELEQFTEELEQFRKLAREGSQYWHQKFDLIGTAN